MIEILGLIGITLIITTGYIFENFRFWILEKNKFIGTFVSCSMCVGFWVGNFYSFIFKSNYNLELRSLTNDILFGAAISLLSYIVDVVVDFLRVNDALLWWKKDNTEGSSNTKS